MSRDIINRVCKTIDLINKVLPQVDKDRKRIISIKFIIHKLFVTSNRTLKYYEEYWNNIESLIGDKRNYIFLSYFSLFCQK